MSICKRCGKITHSSQYGKTKNMPIICRQCRRENNKCKQCQNPIRADKGRRRKKTGLCRSCLSTNLWKNKRKQENNKP